MELSQFNSLQPLRNPTNMVKASSSISEKTTISGTKRDLSQTLDEESKVSVSDEHEDVVQVSGPSSDSKPGSIAFDDLYLRCFVIEEFSEVTDARIKTDDPGVTIIKKVFNCVTVNPLGHRRVVTTWNHNAKKFWMFVRLVFLQWYWLLKYNY